MGRVPFASFRIRACPQAKTTSTPQSHKNKLSLTCMMNYKTLGLGGIKQTIGWRFAWLVCDVRGVTSPSVLVVWVRVGHLWLVL